MCVGDRICLYLGFEVTFGDFRYPVPPRGVLLMYFAACGSPAHLDSACVVPPPETTQETTFRWAPGPVESSGVGAGAGGKGTASYKNCRQNIDLLPFVECESLVNWLVTGACRVSQPPATHPKGSWTPCSALANLLSPIETALTR